MLQPSLFNHARFNVITYHRKTRSDDIAKYYELKEKLGTGSFATVRRAIRNSDKKEFAIKVIKKGRLTDEELTVVHDEVKIMRQIQHKNCVKLFEIFETPKKICMVMELLTGGELFDRIQAKQSYSELEASELIRDLASGINYLHNIGIVHRDLKPENLIYVTKDNNSPIKITDFGLAKAKEKGQQRAAMTTACGTPGYVAPEILKGESYDHMVDLWSLGVILYILLCGFPPFYSDSTKALYLQIMRGQYSFPDPYWTDISPEAKDLIRGLLTVEPSKRMTAADVLKHQWISGGKATNKSLGNEYAQRIRLLQAKRKLRRTVQIIVALNKFAGILEAVANEPSAAGSTTTTNSIGSSSTSTGSSA